MVTWTSSSQILADSLLYFEQQSPGKFQFVEANPFLKIRDRIKFRKPLMVDWNNDGLMDLVLFQQPMRPALESWLKGRFLLLTLVFDMFGSRGWFFEGSVVAVTLGVRCNQCKP